MIPYQLVWLIALLPLFSFILNGLIIRLFVKKQSKIYGYITILAIATSAVFVSIVSLMVQIYSLGYMHGDEAGYYRYYTWMSLFTFSMLGLVLSDNLLFTFVFWELVGLCSYLLIGFWFHRKPAAAAAKK